MQLKEKMLISSFISSIIGVAMTTTPIMGFSAFLGDFRTSEPISALNFGDIPRYDKSLDPNSTSTPPEIGGIAETASSTALTETACSCVSFARSISKVGQPPRVDFAKNLPVNKSSPIPDYWVIFGEGFYGKAGHTGIIKHFEGTLLTFIGCNYPKGETRVMTIDIRDRKYGLKGFWSEE